jgi:membrane associated rhomboid family serine protease
MIHVRKTAEGDAMFPVGDENPTARTPVVNWILIALNLVMFALEMLGGDTFILRWAFIPQRFTEFLQGSGDWTQPLTVFSAMFLHAGVSHIVGNLLFLWIFGDNVEDQYGHLPYLIFYLLCGIVATFAQYAVGPNAAIPNVGASGAISGVMAGYLLMFPRAAVRIFIWPFSIFLGNFGVPAWTMIGLWFVLQLVSGFQGLGAFSAEAAQGGVAYFAHIGGFVGGLLLHVPFRPRSIRRAPAYYVVDRVTRDT